MSGLFAVCVVLNGLAAAANFAAGNAVAGWIFIAATVIWVFNLGQAIT